MAEFIKGRAIKKGNFIINSAINLYSSLNGRQITDKEIAGELGITPSTLSKYKNGEIELSQIALLAALLEKIPADQRMLPQRLSNEPDGTTGVAPVIMPDPWAAGAGFGNG